MNNDVLIKGINSIGKDAFFLRSKIHTEHFLHYKGLNKDGDKVYQLLEGNVGAAIWTKKNADNFIKIMNQGSLEPVAVKEILGNDESTN